jgi:hypothetical protein
MKNVVNIIVEDFYLVCELDDGNLYRYNMDFIKTKNGQAILPLKDIHFFKKVFIESGALAWPNGYEIHGDTVARDGELLQNEESA